MRYIVLLFFLLGIIVRAQEECEINTINPDFEEPVIVQSGWPTFLDASAVPGWETTASDNVIEMWPNSANGGGVMAYSGSQYIELNANVQSGIYQDYATPVDGIIFNYSFAHSARNSASSGSDVVAVLAGPPGGPLVELAQYSSQVWTGWHVYTGSYTVPAGQTITRFEFRAVSTAAGDPTVGNFLDAIEFTSNFGLASDPEISLECESNVATGIVAVGEGSWSIDPGNPSPTFFDDMNSPTPTITGFDLSGDYRYIWSNGVCDADLVIHYSNEAIDILDDHLEKAICSNEGNVNLELYEPEISTDADDFIYYENQDDAEAGNGNFIPNPQNYVLTGDITIYVRVVKDGHCTTIVEIDLTLNEMPGQNEIPVQPPFCDDDEDGQLVVDLTIYQSQYIDGSMDGLVFSYYEDAGLTIEIPEADWENYVITTFPHSVWIMAEKDFDGANCTTIPKEIIFDLKPQVPVNGEEYTLPGSVFCFDSSEPHIIDLTVLETTITGVDAEFLYYETFAAAQAGGTDNILNPENYEPADSGSVYVRLEDEDYCFNIVRIDFEIGTNPEYTAISNPLSKCDEDGDGFVPFDLDEEAIPLLGIEAGLNITYYETEEDAENGENPLPSGLLNLPSDTGEISYWVVISNGICFSIAEIPLIVSVGLEGLEETIPPIAVCDDDFDGIRYVDLTQVEGMFLPDSSGISFTYFTDEELLNQIPDSAITNYPLPEEDNFFWVLMEIGECSAVRQFRVWYKATIAPYIEPTTIIGECGEDAIDLTLVEESVQSNDPYLVFSYYLSLEDLINLTNPIQNPQNFTPENNEGEVYLRLDRVNFCANYFLFDYKLRELPENPFEDLPTLCPGNELVLDAGNEYPEENYEWNWAGGQSTGPEFTITEPGNYELTITTEEGCTDSFDILIVEPEPPVITGFEIGADYIIVQVAGNGTELEFSLDGVFWQSSPRFNNLIPGQEYTVYVRESGCSPVTKNVSILFIPNFISPNDDGKNDTWAIRGLNNSQETSVKIFDRYGKIFVDSGFQIFTDFSWNGKYKGENVPSGDYWYIITIRSEESGEIKYLGHISVRNR